MIKPRVSDPRPKETPSEYMDRMLGKVGSAERKLTDDSAYQYYLKQWDAFQRSKSQRGER